MSDENTGQKENPALHARAEARKLKDKKDLTLAEQILFASTQEIIPVSLKFENGLEITFQAYTLTQGEADTVLKLLDEGDKSFDDLCEFVAPFFLDESINPEFLKSKNYDTSLIPRLVFASTEKAKARATEESIVKGFRKKQDR